MDRYEQIRESRVDENSSAVHYFNGTNEIVAEKRWKQLGHSDILNMKMNIIHKAMFDILRPG